MVNFLDFIHLRSSSGMLRKARREAVQIAHEFNFNIPKEYKEIKEQISFANEEGTFNSFNIIFKEYESVENHLHRIFKYENLIIYEAERREIKNEELFTNTFKEFISLVPQNSRNKLNSCVKDFREMRDNISTAINKIWRLERDIVYERVDFKLTEYFSMASTHAQLERIKRKLISERKLSNDEKAEEKKIKSLITSINSLFHSYKKDQKKYSDPNEMKKFQSKIEKSISELYSEVEKLKKIIDDEFKIIVDISKLFSIFRVRTIHEFKNQLKPLLERIKQEGFDDSKYNELVAQYKKFFHILHRHARFVEKMAQHESNVESRGKKAATFKK